ncbi:homer protein homolog 2 [Eurytemora carolleeae]|uniref:homer protein homolog 2 n=1 Tax=Eurytemora carolleeae TaxID=1294199 RepID=UPI000C792BF6|nr:homer protein homolog 2 [Eurytemora carolleeae]|eukprot:XP_023329087.1 homer protein homolog 2-like [Eurytemora affinis]
MTIQGERMGEQPIFTCKAHVFHIDPKTKRSWIPASNAAVAVSFFYDSSRALYRIISVEGTKAVINSTITPNMTFTKTSQKFGQWSDVRANTVYGLGFSSEAELNKFIEKFAEVKDATRAGKANGSGTTPTTSANASPVTARSGKEYNDNLEHIPPNQNDAVNSNLLKSQLTIGSDSPKKAGLPDKVPAPALNGDAQLKYENDRLKLALAQSSANAKKWEVELLTLKNNNARLTSALQESTSNVEEWKRQLHSYKEENARLKMNLLEAEAGRGNCDYDAVGELRELRAHFEDVERELGEKNEEIRKLKTEGGGGSKLDLEEIKSLQVENESLKLTLDKTQSQLDTSLDAQDQQRKVLEAINRQFGDYVHHLGELQNELTQVLNT